MKKILFALASVALVSCTQDEDLAVIAPEAITFNNAFVDNTTRAIDDFTQTGNTLPSFQVWGTTKGDETNAEIVPIFNNVTVSATRSEGSTTTWGYGEAYTQYWINGNTYKFAAVFGAGSVAVTDGIPSKITYDATTQKDLLYAENDFGKYSKPEQGTTSPVEFTFSHLLSKVFFTVKNTIANNPTGNVYQYRVSNIQFTNAYLNGDFKVTSVTPATETTSEVVNWEWSLSNPNTVKFSNMSGNTDQSPIIVGKVGGEEEATSHFARLVIPAAYNGDNKLHITCKIETLLNGSVIDVEDFSKKIDHTFVAGYAYNFIISKGAPGEQIKFSVTKVNEWNETHSDYNKEL